MKDIFGGRRGMRVVAGVVAVAGLAVAGCGSAANSSSNDSAAAKPLDPATLGPKGIIGQGPNGESPESVAKLVIDDADAAKLKAGNYEVGIVVQTGAIDWSKLTVRAITAELKKYNVKVAGVVDPQMKVDKQIAGVEDLIQRKPDAIIAIPVDDTATAPTFKKVSQAGIKLIIMDNVPKGLKWPKDYQGMVSADSQGNGEIAAQTLANQVPKDGTMGIIGFGVDFFVTNERVIGVKRWLKANRPDIKLKQANFNDPDEADRIAQNFLTANPDIKGLFVVWDAPAMGAASSVRTVGKNIPISTIDLGLQAAVELATKGGLMVGIGAQRPYDQGLAEARAALRAIVGKSSPPWVGVQSLAVVPSNVLEAYKTVWKTDPPQELVDACKANPACQK